MTMGKHVLVTGGAGFLGSHLCDRLLADGHRVTCLDNFLTGSRGNIAHLNGRPGFTLIEQDVADPIAVDAQLIFNLACPASPIHYQADPIRTTRTCVLGAISVLDAARRTGARVLQASTSEVYGDPAVHPQPESYWGHVNPVGIRSCYDEGKRCAETLFFDYHRQAGVDIRVARIFNTYGPRMHPQDGRVVSNFIVQALAGADLTIYGDGRQTRSFCYVDDLIEAMIALMAAEQAGPGPFNIGNPAEYTMLGLASAVIELTGSPSRLIHRDLPADDPRQRRPDLARTQAVIDWRPHVDLRTGLGRTIDYFRDQAAGDRRIAAARS